MKGLLLLVLVALALATAATATAGNGNGNDHGHHYRPPTPNHHHHDPPPPPCKGDECSPPPCVEDCSPPPVVPPVVPPLVVEAPAYVPGNHDAFCYGYGADSYLWALPADVTGYGWTTLHVAFAVAGVDPTGVMQNGYRPYCGTDLKAAGGYVDNDGWTTTSKMDEFPGSTFTYPDGSPAQAEAYRIVG